MNDNGKNGSENRVTRKPANGAEKDRIKRFLSIGPSSDCNCPVCIFTQSQAPGQPYDLSQCPKYNVITLEKDILIKQGKEHT